MAAFCTIVARTGFVEELEEALNHNISFSTDPHARLVAEEEAQALEIALEQFKNDAHMTDWYVNPDDIDAYEKTNSDGEIIGWSIYAGGGEKFMDED